MILAAALTVLAVLLLKYRRFSGYQVTHSIEMSNSEENTEYFSYGSGYLKCAGDGVTYFTHDRIIWSETFSMLQPLIDISGDYIAVADMGQQNVYLYDRSGYVNRIHLARNITDLEVSRAGVIAIASNEGNVNYIEIRDRQGNEIMTQKSIFSSSGYLMDLTLSEDGSRMAAIFVSVDKGTLKSRVVFYDLSGENGSNIIAGSYEQYDSVLLTTIRFMDHDIVSAVGDTAISLYRFKTEPELVYEDLEVPWEIQSLFFSDRYLGMIVEENQTVSRSVMKVMDQKGNYILDLGLDFSYNRVDFAGENVVMYNNHECLMYSLAGVEKLYYEFDRHIEALKSSDGRHFAYGTNSKTEFITLK